MTQRILRRKASYYIHVQISQHPLHPNLHYLSPITPIHSPGNQHKTIKTNDIDSSITALKIRIIAMGLRLRRSKISDIGSILNRVKFLVRDFHKRWGYKILSMMKMWKNAICLNSYNSARENKCFNIPNQLERHFILGFRD